jgi:hypothetical protein
MPPGLPQGAPTPAVVSYDSRLFDEKTAQEPKFAYDGSNAGSTWRSDVWDYLVSKCPTAEPWLTWVERQGSSEITGEALTQAAMSGSLMTELNPFVLNHHMWGFLQHGLHGEARQAFKGEKRQDGFNVWRILTLEINSQTDIRRHGLRTRAQNPPQATDNHGIKKALANWAELYNEYIDAGGTAMDFEERRTQILKILPKEPRLEIFKILGSYTSVSQIKEWIRVQTEYETEWERDDAAARGSRKAVDALEPCNESVVASEMPSEDDMAALMTIGPESTLAEILAIQNRMGKYNQRRPGGAPQRGAGGKFQPRQATTPPNPGGAAKQDLKCVNCGGPHYASECTKPRVDLKQRPCFKCGRLGTSPRSVGGERQLPHS